MSYIMVDIETDGPAPGRDLYSMISIGAVVVRDPLEKEMGFFGQLRPISPNFVQEALDVSGATREQTLSYPDPQKTMEEFEAWLERNSVGKPIFVGDNNGFDWMFITVYFHLFLGHNPFGYSSRNFQDMYKGIVGQANKNPKHLRKTVHSHHPLDDALGNAEALLHMNKQMGFKIDLS